MCVALLPTVRADGDAANRRDDDVYAVNSSALKQAIALATVPQTNANANATWETPWRLAQVSLDFFAHRPVLTALQRVRELPFEGRLSQRRIPDSAKPAVDARAHPPAYLGSRLVFNLSSLAREGVDRSRLVRANLATDESIAEVAPLTKLDAVQFAALRLALTSEVGIIQGPPGTGKSFVGAAVVRVLLDTFPNPRLAAPRARNAGVGLRLEEAVEGQPARANAAATARANPPIGTILALCFTNHALDGLLQELVEYPAPRERGPLRVVRVGSRSRNPAMEPFNLNVLVREQSTPASRLRHHRNVQSLNEANASLLAHVGKPRASRADLGPIVKVYLSDAIWREVFGGDADEDDEGELDEWGGEKFRKQTRYNRRPRLAVPFVYADQWATRNPPDPKPPRRFATATGAAPPSAADICSLTVAQLAALVSDDRKLVVQTARAALLSTAAGVFHDSWRVFREDSDADQLEAMRRADVVGMTTSKAAELQHLVRLLAPRVIVCEEAAEILESHILAALTPTTEHLILFGDHKQLRPKPETYRLTRVSGNGYDFDLSLFERLVEERIYDVATLGVQRRMRPEIATYVRTAVYPALRDHDDTKARPATRGLRDVVVFFDHANPETGQDAAHAGVADRSHSNAFEADFCARLALYLVQQGYHTTPAPSRDGDGGGGGGGGHDAGAEAPIAIITPYLGQLARIRAALTRLRCDVVINERDEDDLAREGLLEAGGDASGGVVMRSALTQRVRVSTVDNFQGEEADIIIISTVRTNANGNVGFLREASRANVMLSRARNAMYVLGNFSMLERLGDARGAIWPTVVRTARQNGKLHTALELACARHPHNVMRVTSASEFDVVVPEGGCRLPCEFKLPCGHSCSRRCHPDDPSHTTDKSKCTKECRRGCAQGLHACGGMCWQSPCPPCHADVPPVALPTCGHVPARMTCSQLADVSALVCDAKVDVRLRCGHVVALPCSEASKPGAKSRPCTIPCGAALECGAGHKCTIVPHTECDRRHHQCSKPCLRLRRDCAHPCVAGCGHEGECPPCLAPCERRCAHAVCARKCSAPCVACMEKGCGWSCPHETCEDACGTPCRRRLCNRRCGLKLKCGHACPSVCGEPCPSPSEACYVCASSGVKTQVVDLLEMRTFEEVVRASSAKEDLDNLVVALRCGHVVTVAGSPRGVGGAVLGGREAAAVWRAVGHVRPRQDVPHVPRGNRGGSEAVLALVQAEGVGASSAALRG